MRQGNDGARNGSIGGVVQHIVDKASVDLELLQRQAFEHGERRVARAEVVHRQRYAKRSQQVHPGQRDLDAVGQQAFGQFKLEQTGPDAGTPDFGHDAVDEFGVAKLARADVDRNAQVGCVRLAGPVRQLIADGCQRPLAQRQNQPAFFS